MKGKKLTSLFTTAFFILTQVILPSKGWAMSPPVTLTEVKASAPFQLELPPELGTIETLISGTGPTVIHIQEAHGSYEVQKKIQGILHHLKDEYGIKLLLLEGNAFKLHPELLRFFPGRMDLTMQVAEELAKKSIVTGPELFLAKEQDGEAYGIENLNAYVSNGEAFVNVLTQKEKTRQFLQEMNTQIERLTSPYLNKNLRHFLTRFDDFESGLMPFQGWLNYIKKQSKKHLYVDLENPYFQIDWPMMLRIFTLEAFEAELDQKSLAKERNSFLKVSKHLLPQDIYSEVERLLSLPVSQHRLPDPETGLLFEKMVSYIPEDFGLRISERLKLNLMSYKPPSK